MDHATLKQRDPGLYTRLRDILLGTDPESYAQCCEMIGDLDLRADLDRMRRPPWSSAAPMIRRWVEHQEFIAAGVPGATLTVLPAAHLANMRAGAVTQLLLLHFGAAATSAAGYATRRAVLGDAHVDRADRRDHAVTAPLQDFITRYAWGDVWSRPGLDRRTRSMLTLALLVALGRRATSSRCTCAARAAQRPDPRRDRRGAAAHRRLRRACPQPTRAFGRAPRARHWPSTGTRLGWTRCVAAPPRRSPTSRDGASLAVGGFGLAGIPCVPDRGAAAPGRDRPRRWCRTTAASTAGGSGCCSATRRIRRVIGSYVGENKEFARQYLAGELEVELTPQGTLAERLRAGGAGIPAFYTPTGVGTQVADGGLPWRYAPDGSVARRVAAEGGPRRSAAREYVLEEAIVTDFALVRAAVGRPARQPGVPRERRATSTRCAAMAGRITIAEVEELVEPGEIDPDAGAPARHLRRSGSSRSPPSRRPTSGSRSAPTRTATGGLTMALTRDQLAARVARELSDGAVREPRHRPADPDPELPARRASTSCCSRENGILGVGPYPYDGRGRPRPDQRRQGDRHGPAGRGVLRLGARSFAMIRGGHVDVAVLGAMQVSTQRRPRQLDDPRQDGQGHGRRDGPRRTAPSGSS